MRDALRLVPLLGLVLLTAAGCGTERPEAIVIGSKNFTEQIIVAELLAQHLEAQTELKVERRFDLGSTLICHEALRTGAIDVYVEYTGTALTVLLDEEPVQDPNQVYRRVKEEYARRFDLTWMPPLGFNNTFAIVVRGEDARQLNLAAISDLAPHTPDWRAGFGYEFAERSDGFQGLAETYDLRFGNPPRTMELGLIYRALKDRQVDVVAGNSTDGLIDALDLTVLRDDRGYFPPYHAAPVARQGTLRRFPRVRAALGQLAGRISEQEMRRMNYAVDGEGRGVKEVAEEFLRMKGFGALTSP
jgi:glycine betaine/choline ABC-type transport system substrate-binding protein